MNELSEQTYKAVGHCREQFADTKGTTRNAVDQMMAGNTKDPYAAFRAHFKDVCLTKEANPDVYLDDLQSIKQAARGGNCPGVWEAYIDELTTAHKVIETVCKAMMDGELDYGECLTLIPLLSKLESRATALKESVMARKAELNSIPNRIFASRAVRNGGRG